MGITLKKNFKISFEWNQLSDEQRSGLYQGATNSGGVIAIRREETKIIIESSDVMAVTRLLRENLSAGKEQMAAIMKAFENAEVLPSGESMPDPGDTTYQTSSYESGGLPQPRMEGTSGRKIVLFAVLILIFGIAAFVIMNLSR